MSFSSVANQNSYPFVLPELPFSRGAFHNLLSDETIEYHHTKHHQAYVANLNKLLFEKNIFTSLSLEDIIIQTYAKRDFIAIFNNAAQVWNHSFYWHCISINSGVVDDKLHKQIVNDFGSYENFIAQFKEAATLQFGSGWVWVVLNKDKQLEILKTSNAETPIMAGYIPLLTCDLWEHAYYIDYRNRRADYVNMFVENLINWQFVNSNYLKNI